MGVAKRGAEGIRGGRGRAENDGGIGEPGGKTGAGSVIDDGVGKGVGAGGGDERRAGKCQRPDGKFEHSVIFQFFRAKKNAEGLGIERPARGRKILEIKKPSDSARREYEGIQRIPSRTSGTDWPHPSLDGEVGRGNFSRRNKELRGKISPTDEHRQIDILTSGLTSLPPSRRRSCNHDAKQWPLGVCNPLQWRNRPRFSRGSLTFDCD